MSRYAMLINSENCMNCKACIVACQQRNNVPYGCSRNWVRETPAPNSPMGIKFQPGACMHCDPAPCAQICPTQATWRNDDGVVEIDQTRCIGCGACIDVCPYQARFQHPEKKTADKCDYCRHSGGEPACVSVCPTQCRIFGDLDDPGSPASIAFKKHRLIHLKVVGHDVRPTLAYLDSTQPAEIEAPPPKSSPVSALKTLSYGLTWVSGAVMGALGCVFLRQLIKPSEKETGPKE